MSTPKRAAEVATGLAGRELIKARGAGSCFLLLVDPGCEVDLGPADVAAACDHLTGFGADGFIRVVRTQNLPGAQEFAQAVPEAKWFMDLYHADGAVAHSGADAAIVLATVLDGAGLAPTPDGQSLTLGARGGALTLTRTGELWSVGLGPARLSQPQGALADPQAEGWDTSVILPGLEGERGALSLHLESPHTLTALADTDELEAVLAACATGAQPQLEPPAAPGSSLVVVVPLGQEHDPETGQPVGAARVQVLGPSAARAQASATSCCAAAVALHEWEGEGAPQSYRIRCAHEEVGVHVGTSPLDGGATLLLTGAAMTTGHVTPA